MANHRGVSGRPVRRLCCAAECVGWPIQFELLEPRILWAVDAGPLAAIEAGVAYGSFANNGTVRVEGGLVEGTRSIVLQPDGKMIVAAWSAPKTPAGQLPIDQATSVTLLRLNRGGTIDQTFGTDGFVRFDTVHRHWYYDALPVAIQADGKLLVGGDNLRRFDASGAPDTSFGVNGVVQTDTNAGLVRSIAVTATGKILAAGWEFNAFQFNADGSPDTSFAPSDVAWPSSYPHGQLGRIMVQSDGKILMAGQRITGGGIGDPLVTVQMLVRLNGDGTVDTAFGDGGIVYQSARTGHQLDGTAAAMQPDGKVLLGGYGSGGMAVVRYDTDGTLDETFGDDGMYLNDDGSSPNVIAVDDDGKIVIGGSYGMPAVWRLNSDGSVDPTFALFTQPLDGNPSFAGSASALAIEPDGDVLLTIAGVGEMWFNLEKAERLADFHVTRISGGNSDPDQPDPDANPPLPPPPPPPAPEPPGPAPEAPGSDDPRGASDDTFGNDGTVRTDATGGVERGQDVLVQPDGKIIVAGYSGTFTGPDELGDGNVETHVTLARYHVDGSLDTSFGGGGIVTVPARNLVGARYDGADLHAALQTDGKIVVGGTALYRFNADGSVDAGFGDNGAAATDLLQVDALAVLPSGKIMITTRYGFTFALYHSDGTLDTTFGGAARSTTDNGLPVMPGNVDHEPSRALVAWSEIGALAAQPDGKVIAVGTVRVLPHDTYATRHYMMRMNADGSLDASFGDGGIVMTQFPGFAAAEAWAVALQRNGKIVVAGAGERGTIARYHANGSLDASFGDGGLLTTMRDGAGADVAVQADGRIIVTTHSGAARYHADGTFDRNYVAPGFQGGRAVAVTPDGDIVVTAQPASLSPGDPADFVIARFLGDPVGDSVANPISHPVGGALGRGIPFSSYSNDTSLFSIRDADPAAEDKDLIDDDDDDDDDEDEEEALHVLS